MNILITGATGLIGKEIGKMLAEQGHKISVISRNAERAKELLPFPCEVIEGDLSGELSTLPPSGSNLSTLPLRGSRLTEKLQHIEGVINLMGESVMGTRWTEEKKKSIYDSRVLGTRQLIASLPSTLKVFVSGSAMGYYGDRANEMLNEDSGPAADFLAKVTVDWEKEAATAPGRVVCIRTGLVLAPEGGALEQMLFPFRAGVGGVLGDGQQWMSWIHLKDIAGLFVFALENKNATGAINGAAPFLAANKDFSRVLAESLGRKLGPSIPQFALNLLFGESGRVITASARMSAQKAIGLGYKFRYEKLEDALSEIGAPYRAGEDHFYSEQFISAPPEKIFNFFKQPHNLEEITPPTLNFHIKSISTAEIQQGTTINYKLKIHGVPAKWQTEIDEWQPPYKFVDNQKKALTAFGTILTNSGPIAEELCWWTESAIVCL